MTDKRTPPIEPLDYIGGVTVVDIGDARVARGMSRRPVSACKHKSMVYDHKERRVWCKECETDIEGFDAFLILVEQFDRASMDIERRLEQLAEAEKTNITRIAAKNMEKAFRRRHMVPCCPHCKAGILPEDTERMSMVGREYETARRAGAAMKKENRHD